jgi:hypothetical protein
MACIALKRSWERPLSYGVVRLSTVVSGRLGWVRTYLPIWTHCIDQRQHISVHGWELGLCLSMELFNTHSTWPPRRGSDQCGTPLVVGPYRYQGRISLQRRAVLLLGVRTTRREFSEKTPHFIRGSSGSSQDGHTGRFEGPACPRRCGLNGRRWTRPTARSCCSTSRASCFRRRSCAATIVREHRSAQLPVPRRSLAGLTEGVVLLPTLVWKWLRPGVLLTPAARFSRLEAPVMSCNHGHASSAGALLAGQITGIQPSDLFA